MLAVTPARPASVLHEIEEPVWRLASNCNSAMGTHGSHGSHQAVTKLIDMQFLAKPLTIEELSRKVREALEAATDG